MSFRLGNILVLVLLIAVCSCTPGGKGESSFGVKPPEGDVINGPLGNSALTFSPASFAFGNLIVNSGSAQQTFVVSNTSLYTLTLGEIDGETSDFTVSSTTCAEDHVMAPNATCSLTIEFTPTSNGNFSTIILVPYTAPNSTSEFTSVLSVTGAGTILSSFGGLTSIDNITASRMRLNWTGTADADSYQIYRVTGTTSSLINSQLSANYCVGTVCSYTVTGLVASTSYTYMVRATDPQAIQESNQVQRTATTLSSGSFSAIAPLAAAEGATSQTPSLVCSDSYGNTNLFAITAQSDSASTCSLTATTGAAAKVSCTPTFKAAGGTHPSWSSNVTVRCTINDVALTRTFAVNVTNTNRAPVITLSNATTQTVPAQFPISAVTAMDSNTNGTTDIDGDAITFGCRYTVNAGAEQDCSLLPASAYNMNSGSGVFTWTPSLAATVGGVPTTYTIKLKGTDSGALTSFSTFNVTVNPGVNLSVPSVTTTSANLSWTNISGASSYIVYKLAPNVPVTTILTGMCGASCTYSVTGLTAGTGYTFRVVALDGAAANYSTSLDVLGTTSGAGTFSSIATLAASEGASAQTASLSCTDGVNPNLYSITSQSDADANCSLTATTGALAKVSCTPNYKATGGVHSAWSANVTVKCALNGTDYTQTFTLNVANTNRPPVAAVVSSSAQTVGALFPITPVTIKDSATNGTTDIDGDALTFSCTFSGGGFAAGTNCTSLPADSFNMNTGSGVISWTPSLGAAVGGVATTYTIALKATDPSALNSSASFNVTVNATLPVLTALTSRLWPSTALLQGSTVNYDVNNISVSSPGNDTGMTYACTFDQVADGAVASGANCTTLPGAIAFNTSTGVFAWTPNSLAYGQYEFRFRGTNASAQTADTIVVVDVRLNFSGITSITSITTVSATLNWSAPAGASGYYIYTVDGSGNLTNIKTVSSGVATNATVTGLTANTSYTFRVRAIDALGNPDPNVFDQFVTTRTIGGFVTGTMAVAEGATATLDLASKCTDSYSSVPTFTYVSETSVNAAPTCSVIGNNLSCTPVYKTGHAAWSETATVNCLINGTTLAQSFTINVSDVNRAPQISLAPATAQVVPAGSAIASVNANDTNTTNDTDRDSDTLTYSCTFSGGGFAAGTSCSASLPSSAYGLTGAGVLTWTPSLAAAVSSAPTSYVLTITASDGQGSPLTHSATLSVTVNPAVLLNTLTSKLFPDSYLDQGATATYDVSNVADGGAGTDTNMSYTCVYDQMVDGTVAAGTNCSSLPGTATFSTATGAFSWVPNNTSYGPYEIKFTGTNTSAVTESKITVIHVRSPYITTNLLGYWDTQFANGIAQGTNSPFTNYAKDLTKSASTNDAILSNFAETTASGWTGNGLRSITGASDGPYRIAFDGANGHLDLGTGFNSATDAWFDGWFRPTNVTVKGATLFSNIDTNNKGIKLKQASDGSGNFHLQIGAAYDDLVKSDGPEIFWGLYEASATGASSVKDSSGNNRNATPMAGVAFNQQTYAVKNLPTLQIQSGNSTSGTNYVYSDANNLNVFDGAQHFTYETWFSVNATTRCLGLMRLSDGSNQIDLISPQSNSQLSFRIGANTMALNGSIAFSLGTFYHVVVAYDGTQAAASRVKMYINGVDRTGAMGGTIPSSLPLTGSTTRAYIGIAYNQACGAGNHDLNGNLSGSAFYSKTLTSAQALAHYNAGAKGIVIRSPVTLPNNKWQHHSAYWDNLNKTLTWHWNGRLMGNVTNANADYTGSASNLKIGSDSDDTNPFSGSFNDFRAYDSIGTYGKLLQNYFSTAYKLGLPKEQVTPTTGIRFFFDAAKANEGEPFGDVGCPLIARTVQVIHPTLSTSGVLNNFNITDCLNNGTGWKGNGTTANPYRLQFDHTNGDGLGDGVNIGSSLTINGPFTVLGWINRATITKTYSPIIGQASCSGFATNTGNPTTLTLRTGSCGTIFNSTVNGSFNPNTWYQVAVTRDAGGVIKFYRNGVQLGANVTDAGMQDFTINTIGWGFGGSDYWLQGAIAIAGAWNTALTQAEILNLCNMYSDRFPSGQACAP